MNIKSQKDFFSGLMFMGTGVAFAWGATTYSVGSGARMGPGYFPLMLGVLMAVLGVAITFKALVVETEGGVRFSSPHLRRCAMTAADRHKFLPLALRVVGLIFIFGIYPLSVLWPSGWAWHSGRSEYLEMIVAIYALTFIASMAEAGWKVKNTLILATVLAAGSYLAFVVVLKLQFPVWPAFITG